MSFALEKFSTADDAKKAILQETPVGTARVKVEEFAETIGGKCFPGPHHIGCRYVEPSTSMVHVVWQISFHFSDRRLLERVEVKRGLAGP